MEFYDNLIGTDYGRERTINLESLGCPSFELLNLDLPFSEEEVFNSIKDLPPDKAPGPDGFTGRFYKCCWAVIKNDIMAALQSLWSGNCRNLGKLNSAYITLIPKKSNAVQVKDFRPISLVHSFAKLLTKVMANRLAERLDEMVSPNQSAFIKKRFIQDNCKMVQQTVKYLYSQKLPRLLLKLDILRTHGFYITILEYPCVIHEGDMECGSGKPPFFDGTNYPYWKIHMSAHHQGIDWLVWEFPRMILSLCLNPVLEPRKIKMIGTTQIAEQDLFFSRVFCFLSSSVSLIVLLLERSG